MLHWGTNTSFRSDLSIRSRLPFPHLPAPSGESHADSSVAVENTVNKKTKKFVFYLFM